MTYTATPFMRSAIDACEAKDVAGLRQLLTDMKPKLARAGAALGSITLAQLLNEPIEFSRGGRQQVAAVESLLLLAIKEPHAANSEMVHELLSNGVDPNQPNGKPLRWACLTGQADVVAALAQHGSDVHSRSKDGRSPLHFAVLSVCPATVEAVLKAGADANSQGADGFTPLHLLALDERCRKQPQAAGQVCAVLLVCGADPRVKTATGQNALHAAAAWGCVHMVRALLAHSPDVAALVREPYRMGYTPLHVAVAGVPAMHALLGSAVPVPAPSQDRLEVVRALLDAGAAVNAAEAQSGHSALHMACAEGEADIVRLLLERKANPLALNHSNLMPVHAAASSSNPSAWHVLAVLAEKCGTSVLHAGSDMMTPLALAVMQYNLDAARELLRLGAQVNQCFGPQRSTPLHFACQYAHPQLAAAEGMPFPGGLGAGSMQQSAAAMMQHNEAFQVQRRQAAAAAGPAFGPGSASLRDMAHEVVGRAAPSPVGDRALSMVQLLLAHGADPNLSSRVTLPPGIKLPFKPKHTPLQDAIAAGDPRVVEALARAGADPTEAYSAQLHMVISSDSGPLLRALLASPHVDVNATRCIDGTSLLQAACENAAEACVGVLLEAGADAGARVGQATAMQVLLRPPPSSSAGRADAAEAERRKRIARMLLSAIQAGTSGATSSTTSASGKQAAAGPSAAPPASTLSPGAGAGAPGTGASSSGASTADKACSHCGAVAGSVKADGSAVPATLKRCTACNSALYCSEACQKKHWRQGHKHMCAVLKQQHEGSKESMASLAAEFASASASPSTSSVKR